MIPGRQCRINVTCEIRSDLVDHGKVTLRNEWAGSTGVIGVRGNRRVIILMRNLLVGNGFVINPGGMINTDSGIPTRTKIVCSVVEYFQHVLDLTKEAKDRA